MAGKLVAARAAERASCDAKAAARSGNFWSARPLGGVERGTRLSKNFLVWRYACTGLICTAQALRGGGAFAAGAAVEPFIRRRRQPITSVRATWQTVSRRNIPTSTSANRVGFTGREFGAGSSTPARAWPVGSEEARVPHPALAQVVARGQKRLLAIVVSQSWGPRTGHSGSASGGPYWKRPGCFSGLVGNRTFPSSVRAALLNPCASSLENACRCRSNVRILWDPCLSSGGRC